jgi:molybdenum cofactor cytidylyltransferase
MGRLKQLLPLGGKSMLRQVTETVCSVGLVQVVVVLGARADRVAGELEGLPVDAIRNEAWSEGMSTSVRAGLNALRPEVEATLMVLADQPTLPAQILEALLNHYQETGGLIIAPSYEGRRGNPVLIDRKLFPELMAVEGDQGARALIQRHKRNLVLVEVSNPAVVTDIDTLDDYTAAVEAGWNE